MDIKIEKLKQSKIKATASVLIDRRLTAEAEALKRIAKTLRIKGFRPGNAPLEKVREMVKPEELLEETVRVLIPEVLGEALKQTEAKPILRPIVSVVTTEPLVISITFVERPPASLKRPDSIVVEKKPLKDATDAEVDKFVRRLLMQDRTETPVDRAAGAGDLVQVAMAAKDKDGKEVAELTVSHYGIVLGEEELLPELSAPVTGMKKGETKAVDVSFAKDHQIPAIQGKKLSIAITATSVAEVRLPALTPAYVKSRMGAERSEAEFRTDIKQMLSRQQAEAELKRREEEFYTKVRAATTVDLAPELIDAEVQEILRDFTDRLKQQGQTLEAWMQSMNKQPKDVITEMTEIAKSRITLRHGMLALADHKKIEPTETELKAAVALASTEAEKHGEKIDARDLEVGGAIYEGARWDLRMRRMVEEAVKEPEAKK